MHCLNAYSAPNVKIVGKICLTNIPSNTAFRGFGGPQGMMVGEGIMDKAAQEMNVDPAKVYKIK